MFQRSISCLVLFAALACGQGTFTEVWLKPHGGGSGTAGNFRWYSDYSTYKTWTPIAGGIMIDGDLVPATTNTVSLGTASKQLRNVKTYGLYMTGSGSGGGSNGAVYIENMDMYGRPTGGYWGAAGVSFTSMNTKKMEIADSAGGTGFHYLDGQQNSGSQYLRFLDSSSNAMLELSRVFSTATTNQAMFDMTVRPKVNLTWSLGTSNSDRWLKLWAQDVDLSGTSTVNNLTVTGTCTGCSGTSAPFIDSTAIVKGSVDATKLLALEVDGFTSGVTRTLIPQNASYTIAGTNIAQTFSSAQTFSGGVTLSSSFTGSLLMSSDGAYDVGATSSGRPSNVFITGTYTALNGGSFPIFAASRKFEILDSAGGTGFNYIDGQANVGNQFVRFADTSSASMLTLTRTFFGGTINKATFDLDVSPSSNLGRSLGTGTFDRWLKTWAQDGDFSGALNVGGILTVTGAITATQGIDTGTSSDSSIYIGTTGNFYGRTFFGADASCSGVTNGWIGIRTDTNEIQICIGGSMKKALLI